MLHTINNAWVTIIVKQLQNGVIDNALLVVKDSDEAFKVVEFTDKLLGISFENYKKPPYTIYTEDVVYRSMCPDAARTSDFPMFDDVLVSHDIHDTMLKSYLSQHCRRKGA